MSTPRKPRYAHCYRCLYVWKMRRRSPSICPRCKSKLWRVPKIRPVRMGNGLGIEEIIGPKRSEVLRLARRYGAENVRVFGSVRRREADAKSDVDLLVDWRPGSRPGASLALAEQYRALLGRPVEVATERNLEWYAAPTILAEAVPL